MEVLLAQVGQWLFLALCCFVIAFLMQFHHYPIIEGGKDITPSWFRFLRIGSFVLIAVAVITSLGAVSSFFVQVTLRTTQDISNGIVTVAVIAVGVGLFFLGKFLGRMTTQRLVSKRILDYFAQDDLAAKLLEDISRSVFEIRIYPMRLEGLRSFHLDVDGMNRPAYSVWGCRQLAWYLKKTSGVDYMIKECFADDGLQARGNVSVIQNGRRFRFSHVSMVKAS